MATPVHTEIHGSQYVFGFTSTDAPTIAGFAARKAELTYEPEVFIPATDGEGIVEAIAVTDLAHRKITGTFTGYVQAGFSAATIQNTFTWNGRFYIVKSISDPRNKGEFAEVALSVESHALVVS